MSRNFVEQLHCRIILWHPTNLSVTTTPVSLHFQGGGTHWQTISHEIIMEAWRIHCSIATARTRSALADMFSPGTGSPSSAKAFFEAVQTQSILWSVGCWWIRKNDESIKSISPELLNLQTCKVYGGFSNTCQRVMIQTKHLETMAGTSGKKVALFKIKLFVSSFLATGSENCIFELSHKLDHLAKGVALRSFAPNSPERTGYMAPIVPSPIQPRATPPPYGMIIPFSGSKNLHKGQTERGDLYSQKSLGRFVTFLVKSKNLKTMKTGKKSVRLKGLNYLIDSHLCRCAKVPGLAAAAGLLLLALFALAAMWPINNCHSNILYTIPI